MAICREAEKRTLALTAVTAAVQDRLAEDVILVPRKGAATEAVVYTTEYEWKGRIVRRHLVAYHIPKSGQQGVVTEELLRVVLDIGHELGHLFLREGPGRCPPGLGITKADQGKVDEIEADWFALCLLQMYGFIVPRD